MQWSFRPAKIKDLPACWRILADWARFAYDEEVWVVLPEIWQALLARKALVMTVFEDLDLPLDRRLGGFGLGIFVADTTLAEVLARFRPYLVNRCLRSCFEGDPWPLEFDKIRQANSGTGVNLIVDCAFFTLDWRRLELLPLFATAICYRYGGFSVRFLRLPLPLHPTGSL